jgi:TetR/AcrR family transcriptional regulator, transcriptional repressor for nem operon
MSDSRNASAASPVVARGPGKRERLIVAAAELLHQQGVERTTLAEIAAAADVPLGNVYYHFKTKDDLVAAVVAGHTAAAEASLAAITARFSSPRQRLAAFLSGLASRADAVAAHGCAHGSLCSELGKRPAGRGPGSTTLLTVPIDWVEAQFREMGLPECRELAISLLASYQGISLIANTLHDPGVFTREIRRLQQWVDGL